MPTPRKELPHGQEWLILRMLAAGYKSDQLGICFGIAHMGMQAILAKDTKSFDQRLKVLSEIPAEDFKLLFEDKESFNQQLKLISDMQPHNFGRETQNLSRADIIAFFDGVELYHIPYSYQHLFEKNNMPTFQDAKFAAPLVISAALEKEQNKEEKSNMNKVGNFSGVYNQVELADFFDDFSKTLEKNADITHPLAFVLISPEHAITVGYDPAHNQWLFIDANQLPTKPIGNVETLAEHIITALSSNEVCTFSSEIYAAHEDYVALNNVVNIWQAKESWKRMHDISSLKAHLLDSFGGSWIHVAARLGQLDVVNVLLKDHNVDPNQNFTNGETPLILAAIYGHLDVVNALLADSRTDPNKARTTDGITPLFIAAKNDDRLDIVNALLADARTDPNKVRISDDRPPLFIPAQNGHLDVVRALLADPRTDPNKALPLFVAAQAGHLDMVQLLLNNKADITLTFTTSIGSFRNFAKEVHLEQRMETFIQEKMKQGASSTISMTVLEIAQFMGHTEIVKLLRTYMPTPAVSAGGIFASPSSSEQKPTSSLEKKCKFIPN